MAYTVNDHFILLDGEPGDPGKGSTPTGPSGLWDGGPTARWAVLRRQAQSPGIWSSTRVPARCSKSMGPRWSSARAHSPTRP